MQMQTAEPDYIGYTLNLPVVHDPGTVAAYCSATVNVVGGVVERATPLVPLLSCALQISVSSEPP